jgi:hypothetical protein
MRGETTEKFTVPPLSVNTEGDAENELIVGGLPATVTGPGLAVAVSVPELLLVTTVNV